MCHVTEEWHIDVIQTKRESQYFIIATLNNCTFDFHKFEDFSLTIREERASCSTCVVSTEFSIKKHLKKSTVTAKKKNKQKNTEQTDF